MKKATFQTEAEMCAAFIAAIPAHEGWTAYAETAGWDILLAHRDGRQVGIQAKLRLNADVLVQAAEVNSYATEGPDYRAILVPPSEHSGMAGLAPILGLTVIQIWPPVGTSGYSHVAPHLPEANSQYNEVERVWHDRLPIQRCKLPDYIPDVAAGASGPLKLTDWKVKAIRLAVLLERTGYLIRADFKQHKVDVRRWTVNGWLSVDGDHFIAGPAMPDFRKLHPKNYDEIAADIDKWKRTHGAGLQLPLTDPRMANEYEIEADVPLPIPQSWTFEAEMVKKC